MSTLGDKLTGKTFHHKVYDNEDNYLATWGPVPDGECMNVPSFTWNINGGMGTMSIDLARSIKDFGEGEDVDLANRVQTYVMDEEGTTKIFDGIILSYEPIMEENGTQYIRVNVFSQSTTLQNKLLTDAGGNTTETYSVTLVSDIMKNILDLYNGIITYNASSIDESPDTITYTFRYVTYFDALKKCLEFLPAYWYWYIDADNIFNVVEPNWTNIDHSLYMGKEVNAVNAKRSIEQFYSDVYFLGGDTGGGSNLYNKYTSTGASDDIFEKHYQMRDQRVTVDDTAEKMSYRFLDEFASPESQMSVTVIDNSVDTNKGYDIESFKPGDIIQINDPMKPVGNLTFWDEDFWDIDAWDYSGASLSLGFPMQIQTINYNFFDTVLTLSTKPEDIDARINNIDRNLEVLESENVPDAPS